MAEISIAILGLGRVGTSAGLALKRYSSKPDAAHRFTVTGYSSVGAHLKAAQRLNAVHDTSRNVGQAVQGRDIVLLTMPYAEVEAVYQYIAQDLRPGSVIIDCSPLKEPSLGWAKKYLPPEVHMIGATPILNPAYLFEGTDDPERATPDLFENGKWLIVPGLTAIPEAIDLGRDLAAILGAKSQFIDPGENDSLIAATENLPALLGLAYYLMLEKSQGWDDLQKLTNPAFGMLTRHLFDTHPDDLRDQWMQNRANLVRYTDDLITVLRSLRQALATNDDSTIEGAAAESAGSYEAWYNRRLKDKWEAEPKPVETPDIMSTLFGGTIASKFRGNRDKK